MLEAASVSEDAVSAKQKAQHAVDRADYLTKWLSPMIGITPQVKYPATGNNAFAYVDPMSPESLYIYISIPLLLKLDAMVDGLVPLERPGLRDLVKDAAYIMVLAHESAHLLQDTRMVGEPYDSFLLPKDTHASSRSRARELEADLISGMLSSAVYLWAKDNVYCAMYPLYKMGDVEFTNVMHHGTPPERTNAWLKGWAFGEADRARNETSIQLLPLRRCCHGKPFVPSVSAAAHGIPESKPALLITMSYFDEHAKKSIAWSPERLTQYWEGDSAARFGALMDIDAGGVMLAPEQYLGEDFGSPADRWKYYSEMGNVVGARAIWAASKQLNMHNLSLSADDLRVEAAAISGILARASDFDDLVRGISTGTDV